MDCRTIELGHISGCEWRRICGVLLLGIAILCPPALAETFRIGQTDLVLETPDPLSFTRVTPTDNILLHLDLPGSELFVRARRYPTSMTTRQVASQLESALRQNVDSLQLSEAGSEFVCGSMAFYSKYVATVSGETRTVQMLILAYGNDRLAIYSSPAGRKYDSGIRRMLFGLKVSPPPPEPEVIALGKTGHTVGVPPGWKAKTLANGSVRLTSPDMASAVSIVLDVVESVLPVNAQSVSTLLGNALADFLASPTGARIATQKPVEDITETDAQIATRQQRYRAVFGGTACDVVVRFAYSDGDMFRFMAIYPITSRARQADTIGGCLQSLTRVRPIRARAAPEAEPTRAPVARLLPFELDSDGDGYTDVFEGLFQTDAKDPAVFPQPTLYVDTAAADAKGDGTAARPFKTIQQAINAVSTNKPDIVQLADGTYSGPGNVGVRLKNKPVMLVSSGGATRCVWDGGGKDYMMDVLEPGIASPVFKGITFQNGMRYNGGVATCYDKASSVFIQCVFRNNSAQYSGGAFYLTNFGKVSFADCLFWNNETKGYGGAIAASGGEVTLRHSRFEANTAVNGGAIHLGSVILDAQNTFIAGNRSRERGAGIFASYCPTQTWTHCAVVDNQAGIEGGGHGGYGAGAVFVNSILWGNTGGQHGQQVPTFTACIVQGSALTNTINKTPLLTKEGRLQAGSPCIGAGSTAGATTLDIDGEARGSAPDIGIDQYIDSDGDSLGDAWERIYFGDLQTDGTPDADSDGGADGLTVAREYILATDPTKADTDGDGLKDGDEVQTHGTSPRLADTDEDYMPDGWEVKYRLNATNSSDMVQDADDDTYPNLYEYVHGSDPTDPAATPAPTLHVCAGSADGDGSPAKPFIRIQDAIRKAKDYDIIALADGIYRGYGNTGFYTEGKVIMITSTGRVERCVIDGEQRASCLSINAGEDRRTVIQGLTFFQGGGYRGGGFFISGSSPLIQNCQVLGCKVTGVGGGASMHNSSAQILGCSFASNEGSHGGGVHIYGGDPLLENCMIGHNKATLQGGGIYVDGNAKPVIRHSTVAANDASQGGGFCSRYSYARFESSVVWSNTANGFEFWSGSNTVQNCLLQDPWESNGTNNIVGDPLFVSLRDGNFRLTAGSPCIDAAAQGMAAGLDADGEPRPSEKADIGADEYYDKNADGFLDCWVQRYFADLDASVSPTNDPDGDGYVNAREHAWFTDPHAATFADLDTLPDEWEQQYFGNLSHDDTGDDDKDHVSNLDEFKQKTRPDAAIDSDGDYVADDWELFFLGSMAACTTNSDADADGDLDADEFWLGSDPTNATSRADYTDKDDDALPDVWELFFFGKDVKQHGTMDFDNDRVKNQIEYRQRSHPCFAWDFDEDGLPDDWERMVFGDTASHSGDEDLDGDGLSNIEEWEWGLDPLDVDTLNDGYPDGHIPQPIE